jgi:hypothetical protein
MEKWTAVFLCFIIMVGAGCSGGEGANEMTGDKPPDAFVIIQNKNHKTRLGSYCWHHGDSAKCVDTAGPVELLKGKKAIQVKPGEQVTFQMKYSPKPNEFHVIQYSEHHETEVEVKNNRFLAPHKKGTYYYSYGVWWMTDKERKISNGDAFYAFSLEVTE